MCVARGRGLRSPVAGARAAGLPPVVGDVPHALEEGGRFHRRRVAEACSWFVTRHPELAGDVNAVTRRLLDLYGLHLESFAPANDDREAWEPADTRDVEAQIAAALDAEGLIQELSRTLAVREAFVLRGRLDEHGFQSLADELGCAVSTVFTLEKRATAKVAKVVDARAVAAGALMVSSFDGSAGRRERALKCSARCKSWPTFAAALSGDGYIVFMRLEHRLGTGRAQGVPGDDISEI